MDENTPPPPPPPFTPPPTAAAPPPPPPPPIIYAQPALPPPRRSRGWMVFSIILVILLAFSVLMNIGSLFSRSLGPGKRSSHTVGPKLEEVVTEDHDAVNKIAVVEVGGIITSRAMDQGGYNLADVIKAQLKRAEEDDRVKAVILKVDSPGGEVMADGGRSGATTLTTCGPPTFSPSRRSPARPCTCSSSLLMVGVS